MPELPNLPPDLLAQVPPQPPRPIIPAWMSDPNRNFHQERTAQQETEAAQYRLAILNYLELAQLRDTIIQRLVEEAARRPDQPARVAPASRRAAMPEANGALSAGIDRRDIGGTSGSTPRKKPRQQRFYRRPIALFGETWTRFPTGLLPLRMLREIEGLLAQSAADRVASGFDLQFQCDEASAPWFVLASVVAHVPRKLAQRDAFQLEYVLQTDLERLLRMAMLPRLGETDTLRGDAFLSTLERIGQVYQHSRRRFKKQAVRAMVRRALDVVLEGGRRARRWQAEEARTWARLRELDEEERRQCEQEGV